ncbi:MAG TPA: nucleoside monophosphate kinase [Opitutaceae bacterium]|nr:nucleoside monophosphate kinase [Opitutaceae bacterium]
MSSPSRLFSFGGDPAKTKLLLLSPPDFFPENVMDWVRSLNLEHVSPAELMRQEISRRTSLGQSAAQALQRGQAVADPVLFAILRKWFWARKPDAGFALAGFPATLLHAQVFDEWLDARDEALAAALVAGASRAAGPVAEHYRTLGLDIVETARLAA